VVIRPRRNEDVAQCAEVALRVHQHDGYPPFVGGSFTSFLETPRAEAAWVAEDGDLVVGHVAVHAKTSAAAMGAATRVSGVSAERLRVVARLMVDPSHRGQGTGSSLLTCATEFITSMGHQPMLDVARSLTPAIRLYESMGWRRAGDVRVRVGDGSLLDEVVFLAPS
jgi:GNAT superfamily N-acetyltransferase